VPVASPAEWDELAARHGGTFFHRHLFLSTVATGLGLILDLRVAVVRGERAGAVPVLMKRLGPLRTVNWLPFPYIGPLVPAEALAPTLAALARHEWRQRSVRSQHVLLTRRDEAFPGYATSEDRTFVVPLAGRTDDDLLAGLNPRRRGDVRRAGRLGVHLRAATEHEVTELLPRLSGATFTRQGLPAPYPAPFLRHVWDRLHGHPDVLFQTAAGPDGPVAVQISLAGGTGLGWIAGRSDDPVANGGFAAMVLGTLSWARDRGCHEFDLVGAPTEGIAAYKRDLGATERRYTVLRHQALVHRAAVTVLSRLPGSRIE